LFRDVLALFAPVITLILGSPAPLIFQEIQG
jgi:hypothetical protein